jgi:DNA polymerase III sliding clamp (beta) subunit (PCNA family)
LSFDGPTLDVQSATPGQKEGEDIIELETPTAQPFSVNYNGSLLTGILSVLDSGTVEFGWEDTNRPVRIVGDQEKGLDVFYLLVPTRF